MNRCLMALTVPLLASASLLPAQQSPPIDSVFAVWQRSDGPGCIAGVRHNGSTVHLQAYGMANLEYGVPLGSESISESGSVAKQFTAAALLLLAQEGKLALDDDIRKHIPEIPNFGSPITLRNLLTHTSGIRDQWALLSLAGWPPGTQVHSIDQIVHLMSRQQRLNFPPGASYLYSNTGYTLLAAVVQRVTGQSLAQWSREHLFQPLGMRNTQWRDDFRRVVPGRATAYSRGPGGLWALDMPFTKVYGNGGLLTTVPDLLLWNDALSTGTAPLSPELVRQMETPMRLNDGTEISYALGLGVSRWHGIREVTHGGATAGYRTYLARWPERGLSVAVLCNAGPADPGGYARQIVRRVLGVTGDQPAPGPRVVIAPAELQAFAGAWRDSLTDRIITVVVKDSVLAASAGGPAVTFTHLGNARFWSLVAGDFRFARAGNGRGQAHSGDARRLEFEDASRAAVLLLGPLYHLPRRADRDRSLSEAYRVLRPGGILFTAALSRFASLLDGFSRGLVRDPQFVALLEADLAHGEHRNPTPNPAYFTTAYLHRPEDLRSELAEAGFDVLELIGIEGPFWCLPDFDGLWQDAATRALMLAVLRNVEAEPSLLGSSAHLLAIGRKPSEAAARGWPRALRVER